MKTRDDIIKLYQDANWEIRHLKSVSDFSANLKPKFEESFGGFPPSFIDKPGLLIDFPVEEEPSSYMMMAYSSHSMSHIADAPDEDVVKLIQNTKVYIEGFPTDESEIKDMITVSKQTFKDSVCCVGRIFAIENNENTANLNYFFMFDSNKVVPLDSIIFKEDNEVYLVLSEDFTKHFHDVNEGRYVRDLIISSISYILEEFK